MIYINDMKSERGYSYIILFTCFLWALDIVVRYPITLKMGFVSIVFLESLFGLLFVLPFMFKNRHELRKLKVKDWSIALFVGGVGMSVAGYLQNACIQKATPGLFSFFQVFQPLFVIYLAHLFLKERVDNMAVYWGTWVILSAILLFSVDLEIMLSSEFILTDILIAVAAMLIWGSCTILSKKFLANHSPLMLVGLRWFFAFSFSVFILLATDEPLQIEMILRPEIFLRFVYMGVIAGVLALYLYFSGLQKLTAGKVSFLEISFSALGMIFSALYTFDGLTFFQVFGACSILAFIVFFVSRLDGASASIKAR